MSVLVDTREPSIQCAEQRHHRCRGAEWACSCHCHEIRNSEDPVREHRAFENRAGSSAQNRG